MNLVRLQPLLKMNKQEVIGTRSLKSHTVATHSLIRRMYMVKARCVKALILWFDYSSFRAHDDSDFGCLFGLLVGNRSDHLNISIILQHDGYHDHILPFNSMCQSLQFILSMLTCMKGQSSNTAPPSSPKEKHL